MYVYQMNWPIDFFGLMVPFKDYFKKCCDMDEGKIENEYYETPYYMRSLLKRGLRSLAECKTYWEGDIRGDDLYLGSLPHDEGTSSAFYLALKQDNNGTSFIVSEFPFMHLDEFLAPTNKAHPVNLEMQNKIKGILNNFAPIKNDGIGFQF